MPIFLERRANNTLGVRARNNMAWPKIAIFPGGGQMDVADFAEAQQAMAAGARVIERTGGTRKGPMKFSASAEGRRSSEPARKAPARKPREFALKEAGEPVSYSQGKVIGCSIGGMEAYCTPMQGESHAEALTRLGLDYNKAHAVLNALTEAGLKRPFPGLKPTEPDAIRAQQILTEIGGITCRIQRNPRHY